MSDRYQVVDIQTKQAVREYGNLTRARNVADQLNLQFGGHRYKVVPMLARPISDEGGGMLPVGGRRTPSELTAEAYPTIESKLNVRMPPEEFLSAPVTDIERKILGLAPRGMLHDLNKQGLDRELNLMQLFHSLQRGKPKVM